MSKGITPDYAAKLLRAFKPDDTPVEPLPAAALIEPLSARELEVLRLLQTELSGPEIAQKLMVELSTFRYHTKNIYSKLYVGSRRAAVQKAEDLNLL